MAENTESKGNITPRDKKVHNLSMEIPPQKPKTSGDNKPSTSKPAKKK